MLDQNLKWSALSAAEVFVLPSYSEGLSVSVLEAMGMGLPVIVTSQCNLPEVDQNACGWVIEPDVAELEAALDNCLSVSELSLQAMGSRGRRLVQKNYSWQMVGQQMSAVYSWLQGGSVPDGRHHAFRRRAMSRVRLRDYDNSWYHPGRSRVWQIGWFFIGSPILRCSVLPSSALRVSLLRFFGAEIGNGVVIKPCVRVKYPWHLKVGNDVWLGESCWIDNLTAVRIGHDACISQGAYLCTGNHNWSDPKFSLAVEPITVGDGAWIGAKAFVAPGVVLGEESVAAAGSVVSRNIPAHEIHAGNPAAFVKTRRIVTESVPVSV